MHFLPVEAIVIIPGSWLQMCRNPAETQELFPCIRPNLSAYNIVIK